MTVFQEKLQIHRVTNHPVDACHYYTSFDHNKAENSYLYTIIYFNKSYIICPITLYLQTRLGLGKICCVTESSTRFALISPDVEHNGRGQNSRMALKNFGITRPISTYDIPLFISFIHGSPLNAIWDQTEPNSPSQF